MNGTRRRRRPFAIRMKRIASSSLLFVAFFSSAHGSPADATTPYTDAHVDMTTVPITDASPDNYVTLTVQLRNGEHDSLDLDVTIAPPSGWSAVNDRRSISLGPGFSGSALFTLWVPPFASADSLYEAIITAATADGDFAGETIQQIGVRTVRGVEIGTDRSIVSADPGSEVKHIFRIRNTGNGSATFTLKIKSIPDWPVRIDSRSIRAAPGEDQFVETTLSIPGDAPIGTSHLLNLTVTPSGPVDGPPGGESVLSTVTTLVEEVREGTVYRHLPVRAQLSVTGREGEESSYGIRTGTEGAISDELRIDFDADVVASPDDGNSYSRWESQNVRGGITSDRWEVYGGDVRITLPDIAGRSICGRGARLHMNGFGADALLFGARERSTSAGNAWSAVLRRRMDSGHKLWRGIEADWLRRTSRESAAFPEGRRDLYSLTAAFAPLSQTAVTLETGWGRLAGREGIQTGQAAQFELEHRGDLFSLLGRVWSGSSSYPGANRDRDGFTTFSRYVPQWGPIFWLSADGSRGRSTPDPGSSSLSTSTFRAGSRFSPRRGLRLELSAGRLTDRECDTGEIRNTGEEDVVLSAWLPCGSFLLGASGRTGHGWNKIAGSEGPLREGGFSLSGSIARLRTSLRWTLAEEWQGVGGGTLRSETYFGDVGWSSRSGRSQVGISAESEQYGTSGMPASHRYTLRPRFDWRVKQKLGLRTEHSLRSDGGDFHTERWQLIARWSDAEAIPVFWAPVRGEATVSVFLDDNLDGSRGADEVGAAGVEIDLDGDKRFTDADGESSWPGIDRGEPMLNINIATLPAGYTTTAPIPFTISIEPGEPVAIEIALAPDCTARGLVLLDYNYDGRAGANEPGAGDIRLVLVRDGAVVAECLTGADGYYNFTHAPPGRGEIRIADGWLPAGWVYTGASSLKCDLRPGKTTELPPFGVATRKKPIIKTFSAR